MATLTQEQLQANTKLNNANNPSYNSTITPSQLAPATPVNIGTTPTDTTNYAGITGGVADSIINEFNTLNTKLTSAQETQDKSGQSIIDIMSSLTGKTADQQQANEASGVNTETANLTKYAEQLAGLNAQAMTLNREAQAVPLQVQENNRNTGATDRGVAPQEAGALRLNALKALSIAQQSDIAAAAATGSQLRLQAAKDKAQQIVDLKYKPLEDALAIKKEQYELNKDLLSSIDKKRTEALNIALKREEQVIADKKAEEKELKGLITTAAGFQAPANLLAKASALVESGDPQAYYKSVGLLSKYLTDPLERSYKIAQTSKLIADATAAKVADPYETLAFAQQYAETGKIPTGMPKGTFGSISQLAKDLPKTKGSLISNVTGITSSSLGTVEQGDITRLYNVVEATKKLKELDKKRVGGLTSGIIGKVFGSNDQGDYLTQRKAIVDEISRMQSGAALTTDEVNFYKDYLPGRYSETLGLGRDSLKKIESFENVMNQKLNNALKTNQLSVVGYSNVDVGGQEYTVGDVISNGQGQYGRINSDGTITLVQ